MDDEDALRLRAGEAKAAEEKAARDHAVKQNWSGVRVGLGLFGVGAGIWFLSYPDLLPEGVTIWVVGGPAGPASTRRVWLAIGVIGLVLAALNCLGLRAHRLGTERALYQANAAWLVAIALGAVGGFLLLVGFVVGIVGIVGEIIGDWFTGHLPRFPAGLASWALSMLAIPFALLTRLWVEWGPAAGLKYIVTALGMLLAVHVAMALLAMWHWVQVIELWLAGLFALPPLGATVLLVWAIASAIRRICALRP